MQLVMGIADTMAVSCEGKATVSGVLLDAMIYTIFVYLLTAVAILFSCKRAAPTVDSPLHHLPCIQGVYILWNASFATGLMYTTIIPCR